MMMKYLKMGIVFVALIFLVAGRGYAGTVTIIAEDDWYPYSAKFDDGPRGIAVDITRAAFAAEGFDVQFDAMNYDRGMALVKEGMAIGCFDAPRTKELESVYLWHDEPLFSSADYFYATSDFQGKVNSVKEIAASGKTLGLTQGYGYGDIIDLDDKMNKEYSKSDTIIIKKLIAKRLDFIVLFDKVADYLIPKLHVQGKIKPVGEVAFIDLYVAFSKTHPDGKKFRDIFSEGLRKIKKDGTLQRIMEEWDAKLKSGGP